MLNKYINTLSLPNNIRHNPSLRNCLRFLRDVTHNSSRGKKNIDPKKHEFLRILRRK